MKAILKSGFGRFSVLALVTAFAATTASADRRELVTDRSDVPFNDAASAAEALGLSADQKASLGDGLATFRPKDGTTEWDNGDPNGVNGITSDDDIFGNPAFDSWTADDMLFTSATVLTHITTQHTGDPSADYKLEVFADGGGFPASTVPTDVYPLTEMTTLGIIFGRPWLETEYATCSGGNGISFPAGRHWVSPRGISVGIQTFFLTSSPVNPQAIGHWRAPFAGVPNWTPTTVSFGGAVRDFSFEAHSGGDACGGGGGGDCDLSPIEAKLDDETRFTDDGELGDLEDGIMSRFDSTDAQLASLESKMDQLQADMDRLIDAMCDVIRLLHTPSGVRTAGPVDACDGQVYDWNHEGTERRD